MPGPHLSTHAAPVRLQPARIVLFLAIIAIVVAVPVSLEVAFMDAPSRANASVAESYEVENRALRLSRDLKRLEAAVYAELLGAVDPANNASFAAASTDILEQLTRLRQSTQDNPAQQRRLEELQSIVTGKLSALDRARISAPDVARQLILGFSRSPSQALLVNAIVAEERRLLRARRLQALAGQRRVESLVIGSGLVQAALLLALMMLAERERSRSLGAAAATSVERGQALRIVESVPTPIALLTPELDIVQSNPAFRHLYEGEQAELAGRPLREVAAGAWDEPALLQRLGDVAQLGRELWDFDVTQRVGGDRERSVLLNARRIGPEQSDLILVTAIDVTAVKRGEAQVRELNQQLRGKVEQISEVNRELEAFSYSVSHDLRAPLRHIAAFAGKLGGELGAGASDKALHYLSVIDESTRRMSQLIDDLLVYSRLGRGAMRILPVDMQSTVEGVRAMLTTEGGASATQWDIGNLPVVEGDDNMLRLVWQNLLGNAIKYSSGNPAPRIRIRADLDRTHQEWVFTVADNGVGFDMAYIDKLFGVFQRLHKASDFPGTGIGLANVRRIVTRHHGRVWAEGVPDGGATFCFTLPVVDR